MTVSSLDRPVPPAPIWLVALVRKPKYEAATKTPSERIRDRLNAADYGAGTSDHYGQKALEEEVAKVRATAEGGRNDQLNTSSFRIGQLVASGLVGEHEARAALEQAGRDAGQGAQAISTVRSGLEAGKQEPRAPEPRPMRSSPGSRSSVPSTESGDPKMDALRARIQLHRRAVSGASFILDVPDETPAIWGEGSQLWWPKGEELIICGPQGVGKTTIAQQVVLARLGLRDGCLGLPVVTEEQRVLYVAADRPAQARRSFGRMVTEDGRDQLEQRLVVWPGPLPFDLGKEPEGLAILADEYGAGTVVIDSLKDVAVGLATDEIGATFNNAVQLAIASGVEILTLHHQRKGQQGGGKPKSLADVFGSVWITSGAGSVMLVWGEAGDAIVEVSHLKQPLETIGPLKVQHDQAAGTSSVVDGVDLVMFARERPEGISAMDAAMAIFESGGPTRSQVEKARRRLDALSAAGDLVKTAGHSGGSAGGDRTRYRAVKVVDMKARR